MRQRLLIHLTFWLLVLVAVAPAIAGRGKPRPAATLYSSCDPCQAGEIISFWGDGYDASKGKAILDMNGAYTSTAVYPDGTIGFDWPFFELPYIYTVNVYQHRNRKHLELKASITIEVVP